MKALLNMLGLFCICFLVLLGGAVVVVSIVFDWLEKKLFRILYGKDRKFR